MARRVRKDRFACIDDSLIRRRDAIDSAAAFLIHCGGLALASDASLSGQAMAQLSLASPDPLDLLLIFLQDDRKDLAQAALALLSRSPAELVRDRLESRLRRNYLDPAMRARLFDARSALLGESAPIPGDGASLAAWSRLAPDRAAAEWFERFAEAPAENKARELANILARPCPAHMAIAYYESFAGNAEIQRSIAAGLGAFRYAESPLVLRRLKRSADPATHARAVESLVQLSDAIENPAQPMPPALPRFGDGLFYGAWIGELRSTGQYQVAYAKRFADADTVRYCVALIDSRDEGLMDIWGQLDRPPEEFYALRSAISGAKPAAQRFASFLLHEAEALMNKRRHTPPAKYWLWRDFYSGDPRSKTRKNIVFGWTCAECANPLTRFDEAERAVCWFENGFGLCPDCLASRERCDLCGRKFDSSQTDIHALYSASANVAKVICDDCAMPIARGPRKPREPNRKRG